VLRKPDKKLSPILYVTAPSQHARPENMANPDATPAAFPDPAQDSAQKTPSESIGQHYDTRLPDLPWSRRIQIPFIAAAVYSVIRILGPTLRFEVFGWQNAERVHASGKRCIWAFWHRIITASW
jgi:hypothetical protein